MAVIHRVGDPRPLVQLAQPVGEVRIVLDAPQVALEVAVVHRVEADERGEQSPVGLGQVLTGEIAQLVEATLQPVQRTEYLREGLLIGFLAGGKAGPVDTVVDRRVDTRVERIDLAAQRLRIEIERRSGQVVERAVEDADQLGGFVVDDALLLAIPQQRTVTRPL